MANVLCPEFSKRIERAVNAHAERSKNRSSPVEWPSPLEADIFVLDNGQKKFKERVWCTPALPQVSRYQMHDECGRLYTKVDDDRRTAAVDVTQMDTKGWCDLGVEYRYRFILNDVVLERIHLMMIAFHEAKYDHCPELVIKFYQTCLHPEWFDLTNLRAEINARMEKWVQGLSKEMTVAWHAIPGGAEGVRVEGIITHWLHRDIDDRSELRALILWDEKTYPVKLLKEMCSCEKPFIRRANRFGQHQMNLIRCTQCRNVFAYEAYGGWRSALPEGRLDIEIQAEPQFIVHNGE